MFHFRLETLRKLRENERDARRVAWSEAVQADAALDARDRGLLAELSAAREQAREASRPGPVDVDQLQAAARQQWLLEAQRRQLAANRAQLQEEMERRRMQLAEAEQELRVLENLKQRQHAAWLDGERHREQLRLDEVASQQWVRKERQS